MHACKKAGLDVSFPLLIEIVCFHQLGMKLLEVVCTHFGIWDWVDDIQDAHEAGIYHRIVGRVNFRHHGNASQSAKELEFLIRVDTTNFWPGKLFGNEGKHPNNMTANVRLVVQSLANYCDMRGWLMVLIEDVWIMLSYLWENSCSYSLHARMWILESSHQGLTIYHIDIPIMRWTWALIFHCYLEFLPMLQNIK